MSKTPEEMAEEWIEKNGWNIEPFRDEYTIEFKKQGYLAGYQAGFDAAITTQTKMNEAIDRMIQLARKGFNDENT